MLRGAAERAAEVGSLNEALSLFDRAQDLSDDERERAALLEAAGFVGYRAGDIDAVTTRYRAAHELHAAAGRTGERRRLRAKELHAACYVRAPADLLPDARELYREVHEQHDAIGR